LWIYRVLAGDGGGATVSPGPEGNGPRL